MRHAGLCAVLAAAVAGCTAPPARCTPEACRGCCSNDVCLDGTTASACGSGGDECTTCPGGQRCVARVCVSVAGGGAGGSSGGEGGGSAGGVAGGAAGGTAGGSAGGVAGGAASGLCDGNYRIGATPRSQSCLSMVTVLWPDPLVRVTQHADGGLILSVLSAPVDGGAPLGTALRGSWDAGGTFTATGLSVLEVAGFQLQVMNAVTGRFRTCDSWTGSWRQSASLCTLTWDAGAQRQ